MASSSNKYSQQGPYKSGLWLVTFPNGGAGIYAKKDLPPPGNGVQFYWLGATAGKAQDRLYTALPKFPQTQNTDQIPQNLGRAFKRPIGIAGNIPVTPGLSIPKTPGDAPGAVYPQGPVDAPFTAIADAIGSVEDFLKLLGWIVYPRNILRAVEFVTGIVLMIFGLHATMQARGERVEGFSTSEGVITRSGLGRVATELGRAARTGSRPSRPRSAPHRTRQRALSQRYAREEDLQRRRAKSPRPKKGP